MLFQSKIKLMKIVQLIWKEALKVSEMKYILMVEDWWLPIHETHTIRKKKPQRELVLQ